MLTTELALSFSMVWMIIIANLIGAAAMMIVSGVEYEQSQSHGEKRNDYESATVRFPGSLVPTVSRSCFIEVITRIRLQPKSSKKVNSSYQSRKAMDSSGTTTQGAFQRHQFTTLPRPSSILPPLLQDHTHIHAHKYDICKKTGTPARYRGHR